MWISVKDKIPPFRKDVLVFVSTWQVFWCDKKSISVGFLSSIKASGYDFYIKGHEDGRSKVTHWMPLPESPLTPCKQYGIK